MQYPSPVLPLGFRDIGFGRVVSVFAALLINGSLSYATQDGWLPDPWFSIQSNNIHQRACCPPATLIMHKQQEPPLRSRMQELGKEFACIFQPLLSAPGAADRTARSEGDEGSAAPGAREQHTVYVTLWVRKAALAAFQKAQRRQQARELSTVTRFLVLRSLVLHGGAPAHAAAL